MRADASSLSSAPSLFGASIVCPHRVTTDLYADPAERDPISPFVRLLWKRGSVHEDETIGDLRLPFLDLSGFTGDEKERQITGAIARGEPLIYSGRIRAESSVAMRLIRHEPCHPLY